VEEKSAGRETSAMIRIKILVEGQTEETFVRDVVAPHYDRQQIFITPIIVLTSLGHKGGVTSYGKIKHQLTKLCREDQGAYISTMFDLYGLPNDFPGKTEATYPANSEGERKAVYLEERLASDINEHNFLPYFMVHEFEALLFSGPEKFASWIDDQGPIESLNKIRRAHETPEQINDSPSTAPSKRIAALIPQYQKTLHGPLIAAGIGLDAMRQACPHFNGWLQRLEQFAIESR
jgi:hypothetical protein